MQRNFDRRVEIAFPVIDPPLQAKFRQILEIQLANTVKGWTIQSDVNYVRRRNGDSSQIRCQEKL